MTKIKLCGLSRSCEIEQANRLDVDYIGFVFAPKSKRFVSAKRAEELKFELKPTIKAVGVFVNEEPKIIADLLQNGIIDIAQLHGTEDEAYISALRSLTQKPLIKAFRIDSAEDFEKACQSSADYILLDSGSGGTGTVFDWSLISETNKPCFMAGGLNFENVKKAVSNLRPFAVDVSSGIETDGIKDINKMEKFVCAVRSADV